MTDNSMFSTSINALVDPSLDPLFWQAGRLGEVSAWWRHVPFAHWIVQAVQPDMLVELGTHTGVSYAAFCHAVVQARLPTRCWAVDTWVGDEHAGLYDEAVFASIRDFNEKNYVSFSSLLRCKFDDAINSFADGSIDLLHIDGLHTYDAVKHDFESWLPKLSDRAVVLFHDTNVLERDFGVWRLMSELRERYPVFEFTHGHGLGVVGVGRQLPPDVQALLAIREPSAISRIRQRFAWLGERWFAEHRENTIARDLGQRAATAEHNAHLAIAAAEQNAETAIASAAQTAQTAIATAEQAARAASLAAETAVVEAEQGRQALAEALSQEAQALERAASAEDLAAKAAEWSKRATEAERRLKAAEAMRAQAAYRADRARQELDQANKRKTAVVSVTADHSAESVVAAQVEIAALSAELGRVTHDYHQIAHSTTWRATMPIRRMGQAMPSGLRRGLRGSVKLVWWTLTLRLGRRLAQRRAIMAEIRAPAATLPAPTAALAAPSQPVAALPRRDGVNQALAKRVVYVSGEADTPGHLYRVERPATALRQIGMEVSVLATAELGQSLAVIARADVLILWRTPWSDDIAAAFDAIRMNGGRVIFDVDDLMIDPSLASNKIIDGIRSQYLTEEQVASHFQRIRQTMLTADLCTASSDELVHHMRLAWKPARLLLNGFDHETLLASRLAARAWEQARDDLLRIGYAGGSRTHQRDFSLCVDAIAQAMRANPRVRLVLFRKGDVPLLDIEEFPALDGLEAQFEWRQLVPLTRLPEEVARFDVNMAPLEIGNPFCEAKSELKFFEAALVGVPTIASATGPFRRAMRDGETGFLASKPEHWSKYLDLLLNDADRRRDMAAAAYRDVLWTFGPERRLQEVSLLLEIAGGGHSGAAAFERDILRKASLAAQPRTQPFVPAHRIIFTSDRLGVAKVTVIVPLYNYASVVTEALESAARQDIGLVDLIIVDDCSTDDSLAVAIDWAKTNKDRFSRLIVAQNDANSGLAFTRNAAFSLADTPWVFPLDADNRLMPHCARECLAVAEKSGAIYVYPVIQQFGQQSDLMGVDQYDPVRLANANYIDAMALISRAAWMQVGGYDHIVGGWEDFDLWCRFAEHGMRGEQALSQPLAEYRVHGTSMIQTARKSVEQMNAMMFNMQERHPWLTLIWPLPVERPSA
ncbi:glycosyltransferase [Acidisoma cellulosilytica]|uniref:Glycosyltransferase n=1 Tax=Acidisoma cellulosilyticum TaxID=2802395 RepID=A0A964E469_9PROT|nr:class I SAM-dependent methyltransferase [Acidisoma cellulosilyticum]MCB8880668.1 glycosyltransferase [Acidisoma cellulosilyticum]